MSENILNRKIHLELLGSLARSESHVLPHPQFVPHLERDLENRREIETTTFSISVVNNMHTCKYTDVGKSEILKCASGT